MKKTTALAFVCILVTFLLSMHVSNAQQEPSLENMNLFLKRINSFNKLLPQEKVYLHFDNTSYFLGEKIWFKAYVVNPEKNLPTGVSKVLYVELLNQQGYVIQHRKLKIEDGKCHGDFQLKDSMFAGFYEVRAYTRYMLNFDQTNRWVGKTFIDYSFGYDPDNLQTCTSGISSWGYYWEPYSQDGVLNPNWLKNSTYPYHENHTVFSRVFPIYSQPTSLGGYDEKQMLQRTWLQTKNIEDLKPLLKNRLKHTDLPKIPNLVTEIPKPDPVSVSFYPEGGDLIQNLNSRVAFKAVDGEGLDIQVDGSIMDSNNKEITTFKTQFRGMGVFDLTPKPNEKYVAQIIYKNEIYRFNLPKIEHNGYKLRLNTNSIDKIINIKIERSDNISLEDLGISIMCQGKITWAKVIQIWGSLATVIQIPQSKLTSGVNQITLFNGDGQIFFDRLFFVNNLNPKQIQMETLKPKSSLKPFDSLAIDFKISDLQGNPVQTNFSLAIRDAETTEKTYYTDNIATNLLLSSELKGYIADPAYYFESDDIEHQKALDLLMLTQGWRRYSWKQMSGIEVFKIREPAEKGLTIDGRVYNVQENYSFIDQTEKVSNQNDPEVEEEDKWKINNIYNVQNNTNIFIYATMTDTIVAYGEQKINKDGSFKFYIPDFQGKRSAYIEVGDTLKKLEIKKKSSLLSRILHPTKYDSNLGMFVCINRFPLLPKPSFSYFELNNTPIVDDIGSNLNLSEGSLSGGKVLQGVTVKAKRRNRYKDPDLSQPDIVISGDKALEISLDRLYINNNNLLRFLDEIIHNEYRLITDEHDIFLDGLLKRNRIFRGDPNRFGQIDGGTKNFLNSLSLSDIESISIYLAKGPRIPFKYSYPGAYVLIKRKNDATRLNMKDSRRTVIEGYSYISDFYQPDYSKSTPQKTGDYRRTLYWEPDVQTGADGKATVKFYNNSSCNKLDISAEGITGDGATFVYKKSNE